MGLKKFLKQIYRNILKIMPTKIALNIDSLRGYHKLINFKNPKYFGEKIQWLKLNGNLERYTNYADKYKVREFVTKKIGEEYLIPLIGVYGSTDKIGYEKLPKKCVLKLNTGSGYNMIITDKESTNIKRTNKIINKWLKEDYYKIKKEPQYKNIEKKILCEKYIADKEGKLQDYKFYCFEGKIEFVEVDFDRFEDHRMNFYDLNWNLLNIRKGNYKNYPKEFSKPKNFNKMIEIAEKLSEDFQFVRVDLYNVDGTIYFGELTFTPAGGLTPFTPIEKDLEYAKKLDIKKSKGVKVLLASSTSKIKNRLDGVTIKCRMLEEYLTSLEDIVLISIDTDNYSKNIIKISYNILKSLRKTDCIIVCSSSPGAAKLLKFLRIIHYKKDIYYFVAGGVLGDKIKQGIYDIKNYINIKKIFVESFEMYHQLVDMGLKNVEKMNNFRVLKPFKNNYNDSLEIKFVFWARVIQKKGIEEAIRVVNEINKRRESKYIATLDIIGQCDSNYLQQIQKMFTNNINYKGEITPNGIIEYEELSKYDVLLFPTHFFNEGLPGTIIDAYVSSLAIVAANWKYASEYILDGENGYIFKFDNYDDFYNKVLKIMDKTKIKEFKKKSKVLSDNYDCSKVLEKFTNNLIKNGGSVR